MNYIKLTGPVSYNLGGNRDEFQFLNIERVNIICDTTLGAITIQLPKMSQLGRFLNYEVIVDHTAGNAVTNPINIVVGDPADNINGAGGVILNATKQKMHFLVASLTDWMVVQSGCCVSTFHDEYQDGQTSDPGVVTTQAYIDTTKPFLVIKDGAVLGQTSVSPPVTRGYTLTNRAAPEVGTDIHFTDPLVDADIQIQYYSTNLTT